MNSPVQTRQSASAQGPLENRLTSKMPPPPPAWRAVAIGAILAPVSVYYGNYAFVVVQALLWGQTSMLRGAVFVLFAVCVANLAFRKLAGRAGLAPSEMLIVYSMVAISTCVSGFGMLQWLINMLPALPHFANSVNHYDRFAHYLLPFLVPHNQTVIDDFYRGGVSMYRKDILLDWAAPVTVWSVFILVMTWVTLCLCALVRKQWIEGERLNFPLVYLPIEMAKGAAGSVPFFRNWLMWAGFGLAGLLESINYVNYMYPSMPSIQIKPLHLEAYLTTPPWNSVGTFTTAFYPFAIGIAFLLSVETSFSCWFFYLLTKVQYILANEWGLSQGGLSAHSGLASPPYIGEQGVGAFIAFALFLLYRSRKPIARAIASAWSRTAAADSADPDSPLSPRAAVWGALLGMAALTAFVCVMGIPLWAAFVFWIVYFLFLVVLTRIVSEAGAGWAYGPLVPVHGVLTDLVGVQGFDGKSLTTMGYLGWFDTEFRDAPMPHQMAAMKLGQESKTRPGSLLGGLLLAALIGVVFGFWTYLHIYYQFGAATAQVRPALLAAGTGMLDHINHWFIAPTPPDKNAIGAMLAGAAIMLALATIRQNVLWWPFHPVGYALAGTLSMEYMWCPFLIGWLVKSVMLRYGGIAMYRKALPFFLGLILGDYIVPTLWGIWGTCAGTQVYMAFPH